MTLADLQAPGPARSAATAAIARELLMGLSVCGDRGRALAARLLDAGLAAAQRTEAP
jgi:hypothetical protein